MKNEAIVIIDASADGSAGVSRSIRVSQILTMD